MTVNASGDVDRSSIGSGNSIGERPVAKITRKHTIGEFEKFCVCVCVCVCVCDSRASATAVIQEANFVAAVGVGKCGQSVRVPRGRTICAVI